MITTVIFAKQMRLDDRCRAKLGYAAYIGTVFTKRANNGSRGGTFHGCPFVQPLSTEMTC